jgi:prepilin-type N-terminal cleavage/methylation domain-containing protein
MRDAERGMTLLEVMVALAILGGAGSALIAALAGGMRSEGDMRNREESVMAGDRVLAAMALLSRADLDRRLGRHVVGAFVVEVQRPDPALYRIGIADSLRPDVESLVTVVYRPEPLPK